MAGAKISADAVPARLRNCDPYQGMPSGMPKSPKNECAFRRCPTASIIPLMSFLRFFMLLSLVVWLGGVIFLAFVLAPTAFSPGLLPSRHLAGSIVGRSLDLLHYIAIVSGIVFLIASMLYSRITTGNARPLTTRHLLIVLMLLLTVISQFAISPKLHAIRAEVGVIDTVPVDSPQRLEFNRLHMWSEKFEEAVLLLGLVALYMTAQAFR
jgi:uncharacterized membrane protein